MFITPKCVDRSKHLIRHLQWYGSLIQINIDIIKNKKISFELI